MLLLLQIIIVLKSKYFIQTKTSKQITEDIMVSEMHAFASSCAYFFLSNKIKLVC